MKFIGKRQSIGEVILSILFVIYIVMNYKTPHWVSEMVDTLLGKVIVLLIFSSLFFYANPIVAILGFVVAILLIRRSSMSTGTYALAHYMPSEEKKESQFTAYNQFPYTLEQEIVKKMAPINRMGNTMFDSKPSYKPLLENLHDASPI